MGEEFLGTKELYQLIQDVSKEMAELKQEMAATRAIIRDYNNLRGKILETESRLNTLMWVVGISIPALSFFIAFLNYIRR